MQLALRKHCVPEPGKAEAQRGDAQGQERECLGRTLGLHIVGEGLKGVPAKAQVAGTQAVHPDLLLLQRQVPLQQICSTFTPTMLSTAFYHVLLATPRKGLLAGAHQ